MSEIVWKHSQPTAQPKRAKIYAFASRKTPGLWRCGLLRGLLTREDIEALARAAGAEAVFIDHKPSKP